MVTKKIVLIISTVTIFVLALVVVSVILIAKYWQPFVLSEKELKQQVRVETMKKIFSDRITGTIIITQNEDSFLSENGKTYILKPDYPFSMYEKMGIKTGQKVEIYGKFLDNGGLQPGMIKIIN